MILISQTNGCSYTLDPADNTVLMYHPLYSDNTHEVNIEAYVEVDFDELDDDVITEAERCFRLLSGDITPLDRIMGGNPVNNIPSVSYTYTDTPMAEEYYGG